MMDLLTAMARILAAGILLAVAGPAAAQQPYPNKPIRFIVPYPPGGSTDLLARLVGEKLTESWGQPVIVDNRGGGNTIIGTDAAAKAPPDGYTIFLAASPLAVLPHLYSALPYDALKDLALVATISSTPQLLVVHPSVAVNNLQEFIALAKSRSDKPLNYSSSGSGGPSHLAAELFSIMAGVKMQHIPYKGSGPAMSDLVGGQIQLAFTPINNAAPHIKSGRLKPLAVSGKARASVLPQVPTFAEAGLPGFEMATWYGIAAPGGTPKTVVNKLSAEVARFLRMPDIREKLSSLGSEPLISTPEQFIALLKSELPKYGRIVKAANIKVDQ